MKQQFMKLSDFQKKYSHHINKGLSFHTLKRFVAGDKFEFDFDVYLPSKKMNLQRGLVWTLEQKQALITTILRDQKIPPFSVIQLENPDNKKYYWQVIDGKQRMNAIIDFFADKFPIVFAGQEFYYSDLPEDCRRQIDLYSSWTVDVHYDWDDAPITDNVKISLFEDINFLGTPQDIEHLNKLKG